MSVLNVGPGQQYTTLSSAIAAAQDGDVIDVQAGTYTNDFAIINHSITIEGVGGMVNLVATQAPPNGKAILVTNADVTIDNVSFSGAFVPDGNGAGIRYQAGNLTLNNDVFHDNQEGLLAADNLQGSITINNSTFTHNGKGDGQTHNLYVGDIGTLTIDHSTFTDAVVGHEIKSRAETTIIENSLIADGPTGTASYSIDLPNGGNAMIKNNVIEQGPQSPNETIIAYGEEGGVHANSSLQITGNTIENDLPKSGAQLLWNATAVTASLTDNQIYGLTAGQFGSGPIAQSGTIFLTTEPPLQLPSDTPTPPTQPVTAQTPSLTVQPTVGGLEGASVALTIAAAQASSTLPDADLSITVSDLAGGALNHGTLHADGSYELALGDLANLVYTPDPETAGTLDLHVIATDTETSGTASAAADIMVTLTPAAEAPSFSASVGVPTITEGGSVALNIAATTAELDQHAPTVTIMGIPTGAVLTDSAHDTLTVVGQGISLTQGELAGLTLTPDASFHGGITLTVTATDQEASTPATSAPQLLAVEVDPTVTPPTPPAPPTTPTTITAEPPNLAASFGTASIKEGGSVALHISATPADPHDQPPTVTIAGMPTGAKLTDAHHDTLTIAGHAIILATSELSGLTLKAPAGFTGTLALSVTATDIEPSSGTTATSPAETIDLTVLGGKSSSPPHAGPYHPDEIGWFFHGIGVSPHALFHQFAVAALDRDSSHEFGLTLAHVLPQAHHVDFLH